MKIDSYIPQFMVKINNILDDKLEVIGAQGVTWVEENLVRNNSVVTSNLKNSISYVTDKRASANNELEAPNYKAVRIGTPVQYALRVEFGFNGQDSLGRTYNQPAKPYMRLILEKKDEINQIMSSGND